MSVMNVLLFGDVTKKETLERVQSEISCYDCELSVIEKVADLGKWHLTNSARCVALYIPSVSATDHEMKIRSHLENFGLTVFSSELALLSRLSNEGRERESLSKA